MSWKKSCENCRHWDRDEPTRKVQIFKPGADHGVEADTGGKLCSRMVGIHREEREQALQPEQLAFTADAEEYWSGLYTKPEFYCAMFEEKSE